MVSCMELWYPVQAVCCRWLVSIWILNYGLLIGNSGGVRIFTVASLGVICTERDMHTMFDFLCMLGGAHNTHTTIPFVV